MDRPDIRKAVIRAVLALLLTGWLCVVFGASAQDAEVSSGLSAAATVMINAAMASFGLAARVSEHFVRKAAHFGEYAVLGVLLASNLRAWRLGLSGCLGWALFAALMLPVLDEFSQSFSPGRAPMVADVLLDFAATVCGGGALFALWRKRPRGAPPQAVSE